jgi:hypothetical protein
MLNRDEVGELDRLPGDRGGRGVVALCGDLLGDGSRSLVERVHAGVGRDLVEPGSE